MDSLDTGLELVLIWRVVPKQAVFMVGGQSFSFSDSAHDYLSDQIYHLDTDLLPAVIMMPRTMEAHKQEHASWTN
jgi:hypothetical protein